MTTTSLDHRLPPELQKVLGQLRRKIRRYVFIEGLAIAIVWLALTFWAGLALDYFPVLMGASEMPVAARGVVLGTIAVVLAYILYRWILRRTWVRLKNSSLALLLEKRFPDIDDSLVTAVELSGRSDESELHRLMLDDATRTAVAKVQRIRVGQVLNTKPLVGKIALASVAIVTVLLFGVFARDAFAVWSQRLYLLSETPWPRHTFIEVLGFDDGSVKVAKGGNLTIRARATADAPRQPPEVCTIQYETADGERGRVNMNQSGGLRDGFQNYVFDGKPFQGILSDISFDVIGNDFRVRDLGVQVVPSPQVLDVQLDCTFPPYTGRYARQLSYSTGVKLARGTQVIATFSTNKTLVRAEIMNQATDELVEVAVTSSQPSNQFEYAIASLDATTELEVTLYDTDGVASQEPYRMLLVAIEDSPPSIDVRLSGIGSAITPNAMLPIQGEVTDDYGVGRMWFSLEYPEAPSREFPVDVPTGTAVQATLDLQAESQSADNPLELKTDSRVVFSLQAEDNYALEDAPHVSQGDRYELEVVTESQLVALLEARELGLRQRFEQMIKEMRESRDSLDRVQYEPAADEPSQDNSDIPSGSAPEDARAPGESVQTPEQRAERAAALRSLRVQRASQHSERAAQEVLGVALSFEDIRLELMHNRIASEERQQRITSEIANPLMHIAEVMLPRLTDQLAQLEESLDSRDKVSAVAEETVAQADAILLAMERVLEKMLDLESYNQLLDLVRDLIEEQESLIQRTKELRKQQALELLQ